MLCVPKLCNSSMAIAVGTLIKPRYAKKRTSWIRRESTCNKGKDIRPRYINGAGELFKTASTDDEWLRLDAKVNTYPSARTFKAIGTGGQVFVDTIIDSIQTVTKQEINRSSQVTERASNQGSYLAVSVRRVRVTSGLQVLSVYSEMKKNGGTMLKYLI